MGQRFREVDTRLGRAVAIKTTRAQFSVRFEREARAISSLNYPSICTVYDVGPNYLVMELVALFYASQIVAALAEEHGKGIVHRDLKPGKITYREVLDFGLARSRQERMIVSE